MVGYAPASTLQLTLFNSKDGGGVSSASVATTLGRTVSAQPRIIKPLASLGQHPRVTMVVAGVCIVLGLPIVWLKGHPIYRTEAALCVATLR